MHDTYMTTTELNAALDRAHDAIDSGDLEAMAWERARLMGLCDLEAKSVPGGVERCMNLVRCIGELRRAAGLG